MSQKHQKNHQSQNNGSIITQQSRFYAGPLPHPDILKKFDEIIPGAADRIISQFESQSEHRRFLEKRFSFHEIIKSYIGIACGFIIGAGSVSGGIWLAVQGNDILASVIGGGGIIGLVAVFVYGTNSRKKYLQQHK